jgi:hypothetical protein
MGSLTDRTATRVTDSITTFGVDLSNWGPWKYGSSFHVCSQPAADDFPNILRSSDQGESWEILDAITSSNWHDFDISGGNTWRLTTGHGPTCAFDATNGIVYWIRTVGPSDNVKYLALSRIDLTEVTPAWDKNMAGLGPQFGQYGSSGTRVDCEWSYMRTAAVRPDGSLLVFYSTRVNTTTDYYDLYAVEVAISGATGTWGTPFLVAEMVNRHCIPWNTVQASNGRTHLFYLSRVETYTGFAATASDDRLHHITINADNSLGTDQEITDDYGEERFSIFYTGRNVTGYDPTSGKLVIAIGGETSEAEDSFVTHHWLWQADEAEDPIWEKVADSLPFPHDFNEGYYWTDFLSHTYGSSDITAWHDGTNAKVVASTYLEGAGSEPFESWLWEYTWNGSAWTFEQIDHIETPSSPFRFFGHSSVVRHSDGTYNLAVSRWSSDEPTDEQQAWTYLGGIAACRYYAL